MAVRGSDKGPFYKFGNGQPLTKSQFTHHVRLALQAVGLPYQSFAGHSFRIRAVTTVARAGIYRGLHNSYITGGVVQPSWHISEPPENS